VKIRRQARAIALQTLFEVDSVAHNAKQVLERLAEEETLAAEGIAFAQTLVLGVIEHTERLDAAIAKHAPEWPVDQLAIIDRNILRLALFELQYVEDVPVKVAVNEAVELAKLFGSDTAPRFVNGVLGAFLHEHSPAQLASMKHA
jgi:transcription antitermination protein NusB